MHNDSLNNGPCSSTRLHRSKCVFSEKNRKEKRPVQNTPTRYHYQLLLNLVCSGINETCTLFYIYLIAVSNGSRARKSLTHVTVLHWKQRWSVQLTALFLPQAQYHKFISDVKIYSVNRSGVGADFSRQRELSVSNGTRTHCCSGIGHWSGVLPRERPIQINWFNLSTSTSKEFFL